jgi:murein L,D-transpeptidase YafK
VKHRKWARFLALSAASAASLCLGAFLSYEAALQQEPAQAPATRVALAAVSAAKSPVARARAVASPRKLAAVHKPDMAPKPAPAAAPPSGPIVASLDSDPPPVFAAAGLNAPLDLRSDVDPNLIEASLPASDVATPTNPEPIPAAPEQASTGNGQDDGKAVSGQDDDKTVPLPPARPTSLGADVAHQTEATLAPPGGNLPAPPPIPGRGPEPVLSVPSSPSASASRAARPGFPNFGNALAALTSSVGGASSALTPDQTEPPPPEVAKGGFKMGDPVYIRIFKKESVLELWMKRGKSYALYKTFPVCRWSGVLGPKLRYADYQAPEGFYEISAHQLNPHSHYDLALNLGYPNAYDRRHGATGDAVMIHGDCKSVGCFAMTNAGIEQIYPIVAAALRDGEREVPVHIFPFRMTDQAIARESAPPSALLAFLSRKNTRPHRDWSAFWRNLKEGYDIFERTHIPPVAYACGDRYEFGAEGRSCTRIAGW